LVMVKIDGRSVASVAEETDLPVRTVEHLLEAALLDLRDQFGGGSASLA
jgi:DNA-directed RNA polymerase specialized sigma24 family protein